MNVKVVLSGKEFKKFAIFHSLVRPKRIRLIVVFVILMLFFSSIAFLVEGVGTLGLTFLSIGFFLPAFYLNAFFRDIRRQIKHHGLNPPKHVYTLIFSETGIVVNNNTEVISYSWDKVYRVYERDSAMYIYVSDVQAFIVPYEQIDNEKILNFIANFTQS